MLASRLLLVVALATAGCAADFAAALHVVIDGPELSVGGGYWIELRHPDGDTIDGLTRQFIAYAPGEQDVTIILEGDGFFLGNDSRLARVIVDAVPQRDESVAARGTGLLEIDRGEVAELSVILIDDPRPLVAALPVTFDSGAGTATVDPSTLPNDEATVFDLWVDGGEPVWLERLEPGTSATLALANHRAVIGEHGLRLVVTAEPADSPQPLARSSGWPVLRGEMHPSLVAALITAPGADHGILAAMVSLLDMAEAHRQFALDSGTDAEVTMHCEHVFATLGGADVAEDGSPMRGDFDESGDIMYPHADRTGIGLGTTAAPGHLKPLSDALSALEGTHSVTNALTCVNNIRVATIAALAATEELATHPSDSTRASEFDAAVMQVRGAAHDSGAIGISADQTTRCVIGELEELTDFELAPLAAN